MGRQPQPRPQRLRADWVYVGYTEAAALAGVSEHTLYRWIVGGALSSAVELKGEAGGRPRKLYRLDQVLALVNNNRR